MNYKEADTKAKLITPKILESGWTENDIEREHYFTDGKILIDGFESKRQKGEFVDYLLSYSESLPLAVIEAKPESSSALRGMKQAKDYAKSLDILFAYSSNGHEIEEFDFSNNSQKTLERFPTKEELLDRYLKAKNQKIEDISTILEPYNKEHFNSNPRYYQQNAIRRTLESIQNGENKILLNLATGTGKTSIAFQISWKLFKTKRVKKILFLADRNVLKEQAYNTFSPFGNARGYIDTNKTKSRDIYFGIYNSLWAYSGEQRVYQAYSRDFFDLIFIDECHRSGFGQWHEILEHFSGAIKVGMTATPKDDENINTYKYFCKPEEDYKPIYEYSMSDGIKDGFLSNFLIHKVNMNIDKKGLNIKDAMNQGVQIEIPDESEPKDFYKMEQFEKEVILPDRTKKMCDHLSNLLIKDDPMKKTIIFCVSMDHAGEVAKHLQNKFSYLGNSDYSVRIVSEEKDAMSTLRLFQDPQQDFPVVATTVDLLSTGFDAPTVHNIVFMKPVRSSIVFKQIMGRGSRISKDKNKFWYKVIDYTNATRLIDDWIDGPTEFEPKSERSNFLFGQVIDEDTLEPISNASVALQVSQNEQVQNKSDNEGRFDFSDLPSGRVKIYIKSKKYKPKKLTIQTSEVQDDLLIFELAKKTKTRPPIKVKGLNILIEDEIKFEVEVLGKQITLNEYIEYSRDKIIELSESPNNLKNKWKKQETRNILKDQLVHNGIHLDVLSKVLNKTEFDEFDLLANLGFDETLLTRRERVQILSNIHQDYLNNFTEDQIKIIEGLLLKYQENGIDEITKADIFDLYPLPGFINSKNIFGGTENLKKEVIKLQENIYAR